MRKLKLQVQISVDGFIEVPNGEMDWLVWNWDNKVWNWDDKLKTYINELTDSVDTILLVRKMTEGFISHWSSVKPDDPPYPFAKKMLEKPKIVFTKTLNKSEWENTVLAKGDLADEINKLKNQNGKDMIVYGGATFDSSLIRAGLIDEFYLFVNPAALGKGLSIFKSRQNLKLMKSISFDCGIVLLHYEPKRL